MTLLLCAATARELAGLAPGFAPPGLPPLAVAPGATDDDPGRKCAWPPALAAGPRLVLPDGVGRSTRPGSGAGPGAGAGGRHARERCV